MDTLLDEFLQSTFYGVATAYLSSKFDEVPPLDFYKEIFPKADLEPPFEEDRIPGEYRYCPIIIEEVDTGRRRKKDGKPIYKYVRKHVYSDYKAIEETLNSGGFCTLNPVTYIGRRRTSTNARYLYALTFDLDGVEIVGNIDDLFHQMDTGHIPRATFVSCSGNGLHLYYQLERPIACFDNILYQLNHLKHGLTMKIWNKYTTNQYKNIQFQPALQPFRMVGSPTKDYARTHNRVRVYRTGTPTTIEKLNEYVHSDYQVKTINYMSHLTLEQAEKKYPDWFERRIVNGLPKGSWQAKSDLYNWWLSEIKKKTVDGHRYWNVMLLACYALKSGIPYEQLKKDAYALVDPFDELSKRVENPFLRSDVTKAIKAYKNPKSAYISIDAIEYYSGIHIERNRRNGRKQSLHLKIARSNQEIINEEKGTNWRDGNGRKPKQQLVADWRREHPDGKKIDCERDTGLSRHTVLKWWNT